MSVRNTIFLSRFIPIVKGLQSHLGSLYEIILHDVSEPDASIVYIAGNLTNRPIGGPLTNVVIEELKRHGNDAQDMIGYITDLSDGRRFKSSTIFLRDEQGTLMGCLCINMDITGIQSTVNFLMESISLTQPVNREFFGRNVNEVVDDIVEQQIAATGIPASQMSKTDRMNFITELDAKGVFDVKGSVDRVANILGISVFTVYSYLKEIGNPQR